MLLPLALGALGGLVVGRITAPSRGRYPLGPPLPPPPGLVPLGPAPAGTKGYFGPPMMSYPGAYPRR